MAIALTIRGTGVYAPRRRVGSAEIDARMGRPEGWTEQQFRIRERGVAAPDETSSFMGAEAGRAALQAAGWAAEDLDLIVGACGVMEQPIPGVAPLVQRRLGLGASGTPAFDVNATCLSFLLAIDVVALGMAAGRWRRVLIVSSDIASAALDFSDPEASVIFGDGAAAVAVEAGGEGSLASLRFETYGEGADLCRLEAGGTRLRPHEDLPGFLAEARFRMDGPGVFRAVGKRLARTAAAAAEAAGLGLDQIDLVIPHQASAPGLALLGRMLGLADRTVDIFADTGNQIAASLPTALHAAAATGRLKRGDHCLLIGTSAGVSLGAAVLRW
jgi:3-oxoacyl-[acyl-carrier-protein] synthase-3